MTLSSTKSSTTLNGDGANKDFVFNDFKVWDENEIAVSVLNVDNLSLEVTSNYTVTLNADQDTNPGGTLTYPVTGDALLSTDKITVRRDMGFLQETDYQRGRGFNPESMEEAMDRIKAELQQLLEYMSRAPKIAPGFVDLTELEFPPPSEGHYIRWNAAGDALEATGDVDTALNVNTAETVTNAANVETGTTVENADNVDAGAVTNAVTVTNAANVETGTTVENADNVEAGAVTNAQAVTNAANVETGTTVENADNVESGAVTNAINVGSTPNVGSATTVTDADNVENADNVQTVQNTPNVEYTPHVENATTVQQVSLGAVGVTATPEEINNNVDGVNIRGLTLAINAGTNPNTLLAFTSSTWRGDVFANTDNIDGVVGDFDYSAGLNVLRLAESGFSGEPVGVLSAAVRWNLCGVAVTCEAYVDTFNGGIAVRLFDVATGAVVVIDDLVAGGGSIQLQISYVTDA